MKTKRPKKQCSAGCENVLVGNEILDMENEAIKMMETELRCRSVAGHLPSVHQVLILSLSTVKMNQLDNYKLRSELEDQGGNS